MTVQEADKINQLFKNIDTLTAENAALKNNTHDHSELASKLISIEQKLDKLLEGKTK
jgi:hypothetical protein